MFSVSIDFPMSFASTNTLSHLGACSDTTTSLPVASPPNGIWNLGSPPFRLILPSRRKLITRHFSFSIKASQQKQKQMEVLSFPHAGFQSLESMLAQSMTCLEVKDSKYADPKTQTSKATKKLKSGTSTVEKKSKEIDTSIPSSAPLRNKLDHCQILKYPLVSESAIKRMADSNSLVFMVDIRANKKNIRDAIENIFNVRTKKVNTLISPDNRKKAYVILTPDHNAADVAKKFNII